MHKRIYLSPPHLTDKEQIYLQEVLQSNWITSTGDKLDTFEKKICDFTNASYALATNSGTSAIHLALLALDVKVGDEVICPAFTFAATANPILYQGATPIFVDSEPYTWNICPIQTETAIQARIVQNKKPKAIIVVSLYGQAPQMDKLLEISQKYDIPIIEDAAEALGATFQNKKIGTFGKLGIYSFNGNKIITTSAGGVLVSDDKKLIEKAKYFATQAREPVHFYQHAQIGYNYRMSNLLAAVGVAQMEVLEERIKQRRRNFEYYKENLADVKAILFLPELPQTFSNRWLTCICIEKSSGITHEDVRLALENENIEARYLWKPMHLQPIFKKYPYYGENHIADNLFSTGLCLPSGSSLIQEDLDLIIQIIKSLF